MSLAIKIQSAVLLVFFFFDFLQIANSQEVAYLHTNRNTYVTGEAIKFKAYLVDNNTFGLENGSKIMYFQLTASNRIALSGIRINISNGACSGEILLPDSLTTGFYYLSAFTNTMRNYPAQACFNKKLLIVNQGDEKLDSLQDLVLSENEFPTNINVIDQQLTDLKIISSRNNFGTREKVTVKIKLDQIVPENNLSEVSVSISEKTAFEDTSATSNISNYISNIYRNWKRYSNGKTLQSPKYLTEKNGYIVKGEAIFTGSQKPISNVTVYIASADSIANFNYFTTDSTGTFFFQLENYYDNRLLYLQLKDSTLNSGSYTFTMDQRKFNLPISSKSKISINSTQKNYLENTQKLALINKIFKTTVFADTSEQNILPIQPRANFFGQPDETIIPAEYEDLPDFFEIARNIVFGVKLKKRQSGFRLNIVDWESKLMQEQNAMLLINSVPIFNFSILESFNTSRIGKMYLKKKHLVYESLDLYGILSIITSQEEASRIYSNIGITVIKNEVMKNQALNEILATNKLNISNLLHPDFRENLYWNPSLKLDKNNSAEIEFQTSDLKSNYTIHVQGISALGKPISANFTFEVK